MPVIGTTPIYEVIVKQDYAGGNVFNVFHYHNTSGTPSGSGASILNSLIETGVIPSWAALVHTGLTFLELETRRLNNITDFDVEILGATGARVGDAGPNFAAFNFRFNRGTKETRSGAKRLAGVLESDTAAGGNVIVASTITLMEVVAADFAEVFTSGLESFTPVIVGGKYDSTVDPPVLKPEADWVFNDISGILVRGRVTSQVSRKRL